MISLPLRALALLFVLSLSAGAEPPAVVADIAPVRSLVMQVAGPEAQPHLLLPPSADAHSHALRPSDAQALSRADLVVMVGPALTPWIETPLARLAPDTPVLRLLDVPGTSLMAAREAAEFAVPAQGGHDPDAGERGGHADHDHAHEHANAADHRHEAGHAHPEGIDPHAWLDPANARRWLDAIAEALARLDPANAARYRVNAEAGATRIAEAAAEAERRLAPLEGRPLLVSHDALQYFEARFGLAVLGAVTPAHGGGASARHLSTLARAAREAGASCLIALPGHDPGHADAVLPESGRVVRADPMGSGLPAGPELYPHLITGLAGAIAGCL